MMKKYMVLVALLIMPGVSMADDLPAKCSGTTNALRACQVFDCQFRSPALVQLFSAMAGKNLTPDQENKLAQLEITYVSIHPLNNGACHYSTTTGKVTTDCQLNNKQRMDLAQFMDLEDQAKVQGSHVDTSSNTNTVTLDGKVYDNLLAKYVEQGACSLIPLK